MSSHQSSNFNLLCTIALATLSRLFMVFQRLLSVLRAATILHESSVTRCLAPNRIGRIERKLMRENEPLKFPFPCHVSHFDGLFQPLFELHLFPFCHSWCYFCSCLCSLPGPPLIEELSRRLLPRERERARPRRPWLARARDRAVVGIDRVSSDWPPRRPTLQAMMKGEATEVVYFDIFPQNMMPNVIMYVTHANRKNLRPKLHRQNLRYQKNGHGASDGAGALKMPMTALNQRSQQKLRLLPNHFKIKQVAKIFSSNHSSECTRFSTIFFASHSACKRLTSSIS